MKIYVLKVNITTTCGSTNEAWTKKSWQLGCKQFKLGYKQLKVVNNSATVINLLNLIKIILNIDNVVKHLHLQIIYLLDTMLVAGEIVVLEVRLYANLPVTPIVHME